MRRVLQVVGSLKQGGAEATVMNIYRNIDREKVQFDFLVYDDEKTQYAEEVIKLGGKILFIDRKKGSLVSFYKNLKKRLVSEYAYDAIHTHTNNSSAIPLLCARNNNIKVRICFSHSDRRNIRRSIIRKIYELLTKLMINYSATIISACSTSAGQSLYGKSRFDKHGMVVPNAIETEKYINVDSVECSLLKKSLQTADNQLLIGSIASFREAKNHKFMIEIANKLKELNFNYKMYFIGGGSDKGECAELVNKMNLSDKISFLGVRNDIPKLMHAIDILLMPSLYEGFPVTLVESQASGLFALASTNITKEVDVGCGLIKYIDIDNGVSVWVNNIINYCEQSYNMDNVSTRLDDCNLNIDKTINLYYDLYKVNNE